MRIVLFLTALMLITSTISAQPTIQWEKCLGGIYGEYFATSIDNTSDGGSILVGNDSADNGDVSGTHGFNDIWVVKLNSLGSIQWQKSLGGSNNDDGYSIQQTQDGGYIIAGASNSNDGNVSGNHGNYDYWIVKLDTAGIIQWQKSLGGSNDDQAYSIKQTSDGAYIVAGFSKSNNGDVSGNHGNKDYWITKIDSVGIIIWQKSLGGTNSDEAYSIQPTNDNGFVIAGSSNSNNGDVSGNHGISDYWIVKLDSVGTIQWQSCFGGSLSEIAYSISPTLDGGYLISGSSESNDFNVIGNNGLQDYWVVKINSSGAILWGGNFGGTNNDTWYRCVAVELNDSSYLISGSTSSNNTDVSGNHGGASDCWILKTDYSGNILWQKCYGGSNMDILFSLRLTPDNGALLSGGTTSNDGDVSGNHGYFDLWVVKLNSVLSGIDESSLFTPAFSIYPNPTQVKITIETDLSQDAKIEIKNILGQTIFVTELKKSEQKKEIDLSGFPSGLYIAQLESKNGIVSKRIIKE